MRISAIILTRNEEKNIERCIKSLLWCDEIVIIDDNSTDRTLEIIKNLELKNKNDKEKFKIYKNNLHDDFAAQRNFGLEKASGEWVLFVDADEEISSLAEEIRCQISSDKYQMQGYFIRRKDYFGGKWLGHGEVGDIRFLRLGQKSAGKWEGRVHEKWEVSGKVKELKNPILHYPHQTIADFLLDINKYTDIVVQCWKEQGKRMGFWEIIIYPVGKFLHNYIVKQGFLDGTAGFIMAIFMSFHSFLARSKYWLMFARK